MVVLLPERQQAFHSQFLGNGRYQLLPSLLNRASQLFAVCAAFDHCLHTHVVLKSVTPLCTGDAHEIAPTQLTREARIMNSLPSNDWRFSRLLDTFEEDRPYLVIEFIQGETLATWRKRHASSLPPLEAIIGIGKQLGSILQVLHTHPTPIIHRDIKPENLMVVRHEGGYFLKLIDFGNARFLKGCSLSVGRSLDPVWTSQRDTFPNVGSWGYFPPEQALASVSTACSGTTTTATDIYSVGAVLHQLLSGNDPALQRRDRAFAFSSLYTYTHVPTPLATLVHAMLHPNPAQRPRAEEVCRQLAWITV